MWAYRSNIFLLNSSLTSPSEIGAQSDSASALTRGTNDSIASLFAVVCWDDCKCRRLEERDADHTSKLSRIAQRPPATDLSGGKASDVSFTVRRSNLAVADTVDLRFDSFLFAAALGSTLSSERRTSGPWSATVEASAPSEGAIRGSN